jgi:AmiR/NasT family two-component response regulator
MTNLPRIVFLDMPEEWVARFAEDFVSVQCTIGTKETADYAVILAGTPPSPDGVRDDLIIILIVEAPRELASVERHLAHGADGILTLPLRRQDIEAQLLLARQNRRLKEIRNQKIDRLEASLRNRRHIERAVEIIARRDNVNRIQSFEVLRRSAMDLRLPIWTHAANLIAGTHTKQDTPPA